MNGVLGQAGKVWVRAGKVILATAACIARCCGGGGEYYLLQLCVNSGAPPEVPRFIAVRIPFACDGCPLSSERIVIYRGYCYKAWPAGEPCVSLPCAGGRCESQRFPRADIGPDVTIVNGLELQCRPLDATCATVPCVPEETGCCSEAGRVDCSDGSFAICNKPKRFRWVCSGETTVTEWCSDSPGDCGSWTISLKYKIKWAFYHEFACVESGGRNTQATCQSGGGTINVDIQEMNAYYEGLGLGQWAGEWRTGPLDGSDSLVGAIGYRAAFHKGDLTSLDFTTLPIQFASCGVTAPAGSYNETRNCRDGRFFRRLSVVGDPLDTVSIQGRLSENEYNDCNNYTFKRTVNATDAPFRCPGQPRWQESIQNQKQFVFVVGCPSDPPQVPLPTDAIEFLAGVALPATTGGLF